MKKIIIIAIVSLVIIALVEIVYANAVSGTDPRKSFKVTSCASTGKEVVRIIDKDSEAYDEDEVVGIIDNDSEFYDEGDIARGIPTHCCIGLKPYFYLSGITKCELPWYKFHYNPNFDY